MVVMVEPLGTWAAAVLSLAVIAELEPAAWRWTRGAALLQSRGLRIRAAIVWGVLLPAGWVLVVAGTSAWASLLKVDWMPGVIAGISFWTAVWTVAVTRAARTACQLGRAFAWAWRSR